MRSSVLRLHGCRVGNPAETSQLPLCAIWMFCLIKLSANIFVLYMGLIRAYTGISTFSVYDYAYCSFVELVDITIYFRVCCALFRTLRVQCLLSSEHSKSCDVAGLHAICGIGVLCPIPALKNFRDFSCNLAMLWYI